MKTSESTQAINDPTPTGLCLPFKEGLKTHRLIHAVDHVLTKHAIKPPNLPSAQNSVSLYDVTIPTSFMATIKQRQQLPCFDYHHRELEQF